MFEMIWNDLTSDGYSKWFAVAFVLSFVPLVWDVLRNGWTVEEDAE
jgi:hypothetical protein